MHRDRITSIAVELKVKLSTKICCKIKRLRHNENLLERWVSRRKTKRSKYIHLPNQRSLTHRLCYQRCSKVSAKQLSTSKVIINFHIICTKFQNSLFVFIHTLSMNALTFTTLGMLIKTQKIQQSNHRGRNIMQTLHLLRQCRHKLM
jgi:hypothetical protein